MSGIMSTGALGASPVCAARELVLRAHTRKREGLIVARGAVIPPPMQSADLTSQGWTFTGKIRR